MPIEKVELIKDEGVFTGLELIERPINNIPKLVDPLLPAVGLAALVGASDQGKSAAARQLAVCVSSGTNYWLSFPLHAKHRKVIYISTEDDPDAITVLLKIQNNHFDLKPDDFAGIRYIFDADNPEKLLERLDEMLTDEPADLVVCDTWTDMFSGQLNANNEVRQFLNKWRLLANKHTCLVLFIHHLKKGSENFAPSKNSLIGSQGFEAKMRTVLEVREDNGSPNTKHLCVTKGNYLPAEYKTASFELEFNNYMVFTNTSRRVDFERLQKVPDHGRNGNSDNPEQIEQLADQVFNGHPLRYKEIVFKLHQIDNQYSPFKTDRMIKQWVQMEIVQKKENMYERK